MEKQAIILIHEIYGKNRFMDKQCEKYKSMGFDVYCPDLLSRSAFSYEEAEAAYEYFNEKVGFERYTEISDMVDQLSRSYDKIWVLGYSVGATLAWRCSENPKCAGIVACYGSRIRDYTNLKPTCPVLLLFAEQDSFDVTSTVERLQVVPNTQIVTYPASHGFMDSYSVYYDSCQADAAQVIINNFINV